MSDRSNRAVEFIGRGDLEAALAEAKTACRETASDFHAWYALGVAYRAMAEHDESLAALKRAAALAPSDKTVLLALAITRQHLGDFREAVKAIRRALEADPEYVLGYNTLAMTQKLMGELGKAAHNYEAGLQALAREWARGLRNAETSRRFPHVNTRNDLWIEYALAGALWLAARDGIKEVAWPTGEMAENEARTQRFRGWYWRDEAGEQGKRRLYVPNFFNTAAHFFHDDRRYQLMIRNRSTVLRMLGDQEAARKHEEEAEDFQ